jgi:hypothetical protein
MSADTANPVGPGHLGCVAVVLLPVAHRRGGPWRPAARVDCVPRGGFKRVECFWLGLFFA